ncbi:TPM domain-containing protein [Flavobacterium sp. RNTU_13]|uniref:TPM domain-containing protein n=1 Tax=Flavobacterium sp. RNTU_13 TaxID=3375145 RepID=UPI003986F21A
MMKKIFLLCLLYAGVLLQPVVGFAQFEIPPKPEKQTSVYDYAELLSPSDRKMLEEKLVNYADTTSTQIVIAIITSLKGEDIGLLTPKWGQQWGVGGSEQNDNGVMIVLARDERKIWISPGYGVEDRLTAGQVGEMTREVIIPYFKEGDYYGGLNAGTDVLIKMLQGKYKAEPKPDKDGGFLGFLPLIIIIFIIIIIVISRKGGGGSGGRRGGLDLADILILSSLGSGGRSSGGWGGSSGGGGGGFGGGFGGGGFSGGGAGGSW